MDFSQDVDALKGNLSIPWALTNLEVDARRIPVLHLICVPSLTMSYCTYPGKAYQTLVASSCRLSHQLMSQIPLVSLDSEICVKIGTHMDSNHMQRGWPPGRSYKLDSWVPTLMNFDLDLQPRKAEIWGFDSSLPTSHIHPHPTSSRLIIFQETLPRNLGNVVKGFSFLESTVKIIMIDRYWWSFHVTLNLIIYVWESDRFHALDWAGVS